MNATRRKKIKDQIAEVEEIRSKMSALVERANEISEVIQECIDEETEFLDDMSEKARDGEKGEKVQDGISALEEAMTGLAALEDIDFDQIVDSMTNAIE